MNAALVKKLLMSKTVSSIGQSALYKESIVVKYGFSTALLTLEEDGLKLTVLYEPVPGEIQAMELMTTGELAKELTVDKVVNTIQEILNSDEIQLEVREDCMALAFAGESIEWQMTVKQSDNNLIEVAVNYPSSDRVRYLNSKRSIDLLLKSLIPVVVKGDKYYF